MFEIKALIDRILAGEGNEERYRARLRQYPDLAIFLPETLHGISNDKSPWHCHGLAFRMATYSNDTVFERLSHLLKLPATADGWDAERKEWESANDHWSEGWDKFFHFLWQLQCFEYLSADGSMVTFLKGNNSAPDFKVLKPNGDCFYAEAYVYSKWWFAEAFLEEIICKVDRHLSITRTHNIRNDALISAFTTANRENTLECFAKNLSLEKLEMARANAALKSPYVIYEKAGIKLVFEGKGEYQPDENNAQGDPYCSRSVFIKEIIRAKRNNNNLKNHRPNMIMANGLGVDFQTMLFADPPEAEVLGSYEGAEDIDCLLIAACGIDNSLKGCGHYIQLCA